MKQPRLEVIPKDPIDEEKKKMLETLLDYEYDRHKDFIQAMVRPRAVIEASFGVKTPDQPWERIMQVVVTKYEPIKNED